MTQFPKCKNCGRDLETVNVTVDVVCAITDSWGWAAYERGDDDAIWLNWSVEKGEISRDLVEDLDRDPVVTCPHCHYEFGGFEHDVGHPYTEVENSAIDHADEVKMEMAL